MYPVLKKHLFLFKNRCITNHHDVFTDVITNGNVVHAKVYLLKHEEIITESKMNLNLSSLGKNTNFVQKSMNLRTLLRDQIQEDVIMLINCYHRASKLSRPM